VTAKKEAAKGYTNDALRFEYLLFLSYIFKSYMK